MNKSVQTATKFVNQVGYRSRLLLLGVMTPGFLIVFEIGTAAYLNQYGWDYAPISIISKTIANENLVMVAFVTLLILSVSFSLGFITRELTFTVSNIWLRRGWHPCRPLETTMSEIELLYGKLKVQEVFDRYDVFNVVTSHTRRGKADSSSCQVNLPRMPEFYIREYCKLWLRVRAPTLATDDIEAEINVVMGLVMPIFLVGIIGIFIMDLKFAIPMLVGVCGTSFYLLHKINGTRSLETEHAIVSFLFAHWEKLAEQPNKGSGREGAAATGRRTPRLQVHGQFAAEEGSKLKPGNDIKAERTQKDLAIPITEVEG
jgi:hypothetical protein